MLINSSWASISQPCYGLHQPLCRYGSSAPQVRKVNCTLVQALRHCTGRTARRGSRGIALPFHDHGTRRREDLASRPCRFLPPGKTRYPFYRRLGGPQGRSGQIRKISPPPEFDPRTVQPLASRYTDYATPPPPRLFCNFLQREMKICEVKEFVICKGHVI